MTRSKGVMSSSGVHISLLLVSLSLALSNAGPLPNVTMVDIGLKQGSCAVGDVVYMSGDSFPGSSACERCACSAGEVSCEKQRCEPRPGCKAVHRPDHCCPTYQCECEQEGRIYGNGEKLVDPHDPCRVCYCQGGEVVCRRIACFLRDDCRPRLVPGRCCPEYDNCPLRGVTSLPGMASTSSVSSVEDGESSMAPAEPVEPPKPVITIKEITPVSEIPVTDVKIKEILPSPGIEEVEVYTSPKSQLIAREATSERNVNETESDAKQESSDTKDVSLSSKIPTNYNPANSDNPNDGTPTKITVSTVDSNNEDFALSKISNVVAMMGSPSEPDSHMLSLTTKAPVMEEEDLSFLDHNPAFPPIPDDLSVLTNHDDEILPEQNLDIEHGAMDHEVNNVASPVVTEAPIFKEATTLNLISSAAVVTKENSLETIETSTHRLIDNTPSPITKDNPMLNMRSVIPTEILNAPSLISDEVTGDLLDVTENPAVLSSTSENVNSTEYPLSTSEENKELATHTNMSYAVENGTFLNPEEFADSSSSSEAVTPKVDQGFTESLMTSNGKGSDETTNSLSKSTDIISQTEFSSIPIETSDQNPHETIDKERNDTIDSTVNSLELTSLQSVPNESEIDTVSRNIPMELKDQSFENSETTEFILTSFGSQEITTDPVELINPGSDSDRNSAFIDPSGGRKTNVLTDLINLVGDVASISDHTEASDIERQTLKPTTISDSEELIPVNVASSYKSKNKNWNQNSITEVPFKTKVSKQKVVEIEGEDADTITDSPPPYDKVEPTTRRTLIDNVSDDKVENNTKITGKKDIEIITQSYVPTIQRRPTKVVLKGDESSAEEDGTTADPALVKDKDENNTSIEAETSTEVHFMESESSERSTAEPSAAQ
ncbi:uncharacterized protein LOC116767799 isoform X1 [Danaus plexippus]|uniref:uncharacterized protein LOC116767799 isoform X1 n=2 Tax=Danaus plexippus TaxID=13037 RepID=UPI002AB2E121|nr:uncharacterized protein LOC116767799 isoform X1 [Danaus plexippus]